MQVEIYNHDSQGLESNNHKDSNGTTTADTTNNDALQKQNSAASKNHGKNNLKVISTKSTK